MLRRSSYTVDGVVERVGAPAVLALARNERAPARVALGQDRDPLATLIRLLLVGDPVEVREVQPLLPIAECAELFEVAGADVRAPLEIAPHGDEDNDWWVVADRTDARGRPQRRDHVLGVGGASTTLAQLTVRRPVATALDIGTGCGVQALHLSRHVEQITATDVEPRALRLAATGFALSGVDGVELFEGDLVDPVRDRRFDLVVCNPPFVVGPRQRYVYRDGGRDDDELSRAALRAAASVLGDGGVAQLLGNWLHVAGEDWRDRVAGWVADLGCDAWLIERDRQDVVDYVHTWLRDAGEEDEQLADEWLRWMRDRRVEAVGFGWVVLRRGGAPHRIALEAVPQPVDQPLGGEIAAWLDRVEWLRGRDDDGVLDTAYAAAPALRLDTVAAPAPAGWDTLAAALRLDAGLRWSLPCDEATAALVAGCDGTTALRTLAAVLASVLGVPEPEAAEAAAATVRGLVDRGLLLPATLTNASI